MEHPLATGRIAKNVEILIQLADFLNIDVYLRGLYQLQVRLYASVPSERGASRKRRRLDAIPTTQVHHITLLPFVTEPLRNAQSTGFPSTTVKRTQCPIHPRKTCSWRCRPDQSDTTPNVWVSKSFLISRANEQASVQSGIVFRFDADALAADAKEPNAQDDPSGVWDAIMEVEIWHCEDERTTNWEDFEFQQTRRFRLANVLAPPVTAATRLHQYAGVHFGGAFFSSCNFLVSSCVTGYRVIGIPPICQQQRTPRESSLDLSAAQMLPKLWRRVTGWTGVTLTNDENTLANAMSLCLTAPDASAFSIPRLASRPGRSIWELYSNLLLRSLETFLEGVAATVEGYPYSMTFNTADDHATLSVRRLHRLFESTLRDPNSRAHWDPGSLDLLKRQDRLEFVRLCRVRIDGFLRAGHSYAALEAGLITVLHGIADMSENVWGDFVRDAGMLPLAEVLIRRTNWARSNVTMLRKHVLPSSGIESLQQGVTLHHRTLNCPLVLEEQHKPIPLLIDHSAPVSYFDRPGTPVSPTRVFEPGRSPSISASVFSESFGRWGTANGPLIDEDASIMGLISPRSIGSDPGTPSASEFGDTAGASEVPDGAQTRGRHLIVFVHGLLGSAYDFRQYRNKVILARQNLNLPAHDLVFLNSNSNEDDTFDDISALADNLVAEINEFVESERIRVGRMSFVCHSLGGIIARCAIEKSGMDAYRDTYESFTTMATPHLSVGLTSNRLLSALASLYQYLDRSPCVDQLLLRDNPDKRECLLYKLATHTSSALGSFKRVRLLAGAQDGYSALGTALILDSAHGRIRPSSSSTDRLGSSSEEGAPWWT
ncbi:hypothetical protein HKX48_000602, partial [Thoreauomyces humboldtii]